MAVVAGLDEAGFGPALGPLVLSLAVFRSDDPGALGDLWRTLSRAVARAGEEEGGRVLVDDSKKVHRPPLGLRRIEESALALAAARLGGEPPGDLRSLAARLFHDGAPGGGPWEEVGGVRLPVEAKRAGELGERLRGALGEARVEFAELRAHPVFPSRLNRGIREHRNKALVHYRETSRLLGRLFRDFGAEEPEVVLDRHGGRKFYEALLKTTFLGARLRVVEEGRDRSVYEVRAPGRAMRLTFLVEADGSSFPVAVASILAKYVRELFMQGLNRWFAERLPGLRPTAGYWTDARRFLRETETLRRALGIADEVLIRAR